MMRARERRRRAFITGGASGLGAATAARLVVDGIEVITADLSSSADVLLDVTDRGQVSAVARAVGPVDILVNSAGIVGPATPMLETDPAEWYSVMEVNVMGVVNVMHAFTPAMVERGWGRVVNLASIAGKEGNPGLAPYSASKAAVIALTKAVGKELAQSGVLVNAVAPAVIATPMNASTAPDVLERITSLIPMGRVGRAGEVAALISWLVSDEVSFSTGAVYDVSGGRATY